MVQSVHGQTSLKAKMAYIQDEKSTGLEALTDVTQTDLHIIGDVSDAGRAKAITEDNLEIHIANSTTFIDELTNNNTFINQIFNNNTFAAGDYFVDTGSANAIVITPTTAITSYTAGRKYFVKVIANNTGATTINVNGLGTKTIKKNVTVDLSTGDLLAGQIILVDYDGTNFQLIGVNSSGGGGGSGGSGKPKHFDFSHLPYTGVVNLYSDQEVYISYDAGQVKINLEIPGEFTQEYIFTADWGSVTDANGIVIKNSFLYALLVDSVTGDSRVYRYSVTDMASGGTLMTIGGTAFGTDSDVFLMTSDGTDFYFTGEANNSSSLNRISKYTLSGTTLTSSSVILCGADPANFGEGIMVAVDGKIFGLDSPTVYEFSNTGTFVRSYSYSTEIYGQIQNLYNWSDTFYGFYIQASATDIKGTKIGIRLEWEGHEATGEANVQVFTADGTWTKPAGAKAVEVICIGAGGAGGSGRNFSGTGATGVGGAPGGGGAVQRAIFNAAILGATETITVGASSAGGAGVDKNGGAGGQNGIGGADGGISKFGASPWLQAGGGGGGQGGQAGGGWIGGAGGGSLTSANGTTPGIPSAPAATDAIGNQGASAATSTPQNSEYGGASGGTSFTDGGSSIFGGAAGGQGSGSGIGASNAGGSVGKYTIGGGGAGGTSGAAPTAGTNGLANTVLKKGYGGEGGGGGGGTSTLGVNGAAGGNGGIPGGGGGGGGGFNNAAGNAEFSGAGGNGARGQVVVITYF